ncbi:GNAT family N-acetyltransferase [Robiginitalea sp. SC105]|uniref:GNAT family N-acetyltransferase n=1 Tax=Robiginitalea sp. SC105 TaxID=2762332 RepID=UPI00163B250D|nr:GNAT family N-acetyltransferase [Robiginitalea sp. SC105]MBC2840379.1 N-acetyltransferase [Robiginitalea sp. SC105]
MSGYQLIDNPEEKRYEFRIGEHVPRIEYIRTRDKIYLTHTEVPGELEGKGIGMALVRAALEDIRDKGLTLVPLCPFVALFLKRNPEWKELVLKGINIA